ncbi:MAG: endonuclease [Moraxellaceae bacterium]|nr:endonuclease [Moraxellaceae bacterium]
MTGRQCCESQDPVFETAHNDLHNLFPAIGEVNGDRSNYNWGMVEVISLNMVLALLKLMGLFAV